MGMESTEQEVTDTLERVRESTEHLEELRHEVEAASQARTADMMALRAAGVTREAIAAAAGVTPARITQLLGRFAPERPAGGETAYVRPNQRAKPAKVRQVHVKELAPEAHRHRYTPIAWNHARGNFAVRQQCDCGDLRVVFVNVLPPEMKARYADTSVSA